MSSGATPAQADSEKAVSRAMRALEITGRRLYRLRDGAWAVLARGDRRRRPIAVLQADTVMQLAEDGRIAAADEETFVLASGQSPVWPPFAPLPPRALFNAACARRSGRVSGGVGFAGLAILARDGRGPLQLRHVQAGLRLVADAERAAADPRVTMNWDAGPVTRQRRAGVNGGRSGDAHQAARLLERLRVRTGDEPWRLAWAMCVDGAPLAVIKRRFLIGQRDIHPRVVDALERLARAYDG